MQEEAATGFSVDLPAYSGPFDALLSMIVDKRLELTEISLSAITGEFIDYVRSLDLEHNMDEASAFIDVASILVEAKSVSLLPGDVDEQQDEQSMEALRERDMLFARLVQYRAFKSAASDFRVRIEENAGRFPHPAVYDEFTSAMLPELIWTLTPKDLARLAAQVIANAPVSEVQLTQLHVSKVDLKEQSAIVRSRLAALPEGESMTFADLTEDATSRLEVVARFLGVLLFFKQGVLQYRQEGPFGRLDLRWVHGADKTDERQGSGEVVIGEGDFS